MGALPPPRSCLFPLCLVDKQDIHMDIDAVEQWP
jgi:hypothetical protein